jgi:hypothetical protein
VAGARVIRKNSIDALVCMLAALACALFAPDSQAAAARVENRCPRLTAAEYEELDARVQLLLKSEGEQRSPPAVVCSDAGTWVEWNGQRLRVLGRAAIVDEVVDIIEAQLHDAERKAEADPKTTESQAIADGEPMLEQGSETPPPAPSSGRPADPRATRAVDARGGGVAVAFEAEIPTKTFPWAVGPAFDFGTSAGPLLVGVREAFRSTTSGRQIVFMDFEGAVSYGAPLNPDKVFGATLRFGGEWMVAYPQGNSGQSAVTPTIDLGLRLAHNFGLVGLWVGGDARIRLKQLSLFVRDKLVADDVGVSLSLGLAFVDWSRK